MTQSNGGIETAPMADAEAHADTGLMRAADAPLPVFGAEQMIAALRGYHQLQRQLDEAMPEQLVTIGDRQFRKRGYWRAIAVAFNLSVEPVEERREVHGTFADGRENFGWLVTYRAIAPNGRTAIGDGAAFAVEKAPRFRCPHPHPTKEGRTRHHPPEACPAFDPAHVWRALPLQATEHNLRAHAHTRAYTRAISNLVGFAETPAEEVSELEDRPRRGKGSKREPVPVSAETIDDEQRRRLFERAKAAGWNHADLKTWLSARGISDTAAIARTQYEDLVDEILMAVPSAPEGREGHA